jgi:hypothetical protein
MQKLTKSKSNRDSGNEIHSDKDRVITRKWEEANLVKRRKGDPEKVKIALRLRRESIMTLKWIAQRPHMGSWTHVSNCLATTMK